MIELGISLGLSPREPLDRFITILQAAESGGVHAAWVVDSQLAMKDAYVALAVGARETERIALGPGVTNVVTRDRTIVANTICTIASYAPGRILLGFGAGDSAVFPLGRKPLSLEACRSAITDLRSLMRGDAVSGPAGSVELSHVAIPTPPLYLAASQPGMLRLAGEMADGVIVMGPSDPNVVAMQLGAVDEGARRAGRDPTAITRDLWVTMAVGANAVDDVKSWASAQARWLSSWRHVPERLERFRSEFDRAAMDYDFSTHLSRHAHHTSAVSDDLARSLAVVGEPEDCADRLRGLLISGVGRITLTLLPGGRERHLKQLLDVWSRV